MRIVEVGLRDGLQNEAVPVSTEVKLRFLENLIAAGLIELEVASFVSPTRVPQMADADSLWLQLPKGPRYLALVPNARGWARARAAGVDEIAVFTAASETFVQRNINATIAESLTHFAEFTRSPGLKRLRGYVSTAFECPFEGRINPGKVVEVANQLIELGCTEISLGDTIGVATPNEVRALIRELQGSFAGKPAQIFWHFHDTNGTAIANVAACLEAGEWAGFDASAAGLGGCPFAPGAAGNLATEDLVYFLERQGLPSSVDLDRLAQASLEVLGVLGRSVASKAQSAALARSR